MTKNSIDTHLDAMNLEKNDAFQDTLSDENASCQQQSPPLSADFEEFDLDDIEVIESKVFA